jgi:hypothetical protein
MLERGPAEQHISKWERGMGIPERARQNEKEKKHAIMRDLLAPDVPEMLNELGEGGIPRVG